MKIDRENARHRSQARSVLQGFSPRSLVSPIRKVKMMQAPTPPLPLNKVESSPEQYTIQISVDFTDIVDNGQEESA